MPTPERPKGPDSKALDRKPRQISESLKTTLKDALRKEFGPGGRVALKTNFVKHPEAFEIDFGGDIEFAPDNTPDPGPGEDIERPTR